MTTIAIKLNNKLAHWNAQLDRIEHELTFLKLNRAQKVLRRKQKRAHLRVINKLAEQANWLENTGQVQFGEINMSF